MVCSNCQHTSETDTKFRLLGLNLPEDVSRSKGSWTLSDCLNKYTKEIPLEGAICEHCSQPGQPASTRRSSTKIKSAPEYLSIQILRMAYETTRDSRGRDQFRSRKLLDTVNFPETVDLAPWTTGSDPQLYELYSVIEHKGTT